MFCSCVVTIFATLFISREYYKLFMQIFFFFSIIKMCTSNKELQAVDTFVCAVKMLLNEMYLLFYTLPLLSLLLETFLSYTICACTLHMKNMNKYLFEIVFTLTLFCSKKITKYVVIGFIFTCNYHYLADLQILLRVCVGNIGK